MGPARSPACILAQISASSRSILGIGTRPFVSFQSLRQTRVLMTHSGEQNFWLYDSDEWQPDPNGLLTWLANELQKAEDKDERVWLMAHMSTGVADFMQDSSAIFDQVRGPLSLSVAELSDNVLNNRLFSAIIKRLISLISTSRNES